VLRSYSLIGGPLERNGGGRGFVSGTMATETHLIKVHGDLLVGGLARTLFTPTIGVTGSLRRLTAFVKGWRTPARARVGR
jgi:hypothetical protein